MATRYPLGHPAVVGDSPADPGGRAPQPFETVVLDLSPVDLLASAGVQLLHELSTHDRIGVAAAHCGDTVLAVGVPPSRTGMPGPDDDTWTGLPF